MHDAQLHLDLRPDRPCRVGQALQAVAAQDQHVSDASGLQLGEGPHPVLRGLAAGRADPQAQDVAFAVNGDAHRHIHGAVRDVSVTDLDPDPVDKDHRVDRVERTRLPRLHVAGDHGR